MPKADIERVFPALAACDFRITSPATPVYNCVAWAAGETHRWWDPSTGGGYYWPTTAPSALSPAAVVAVCATLGYQPCADGRLEPGFEKLAVYANEHGSPTHIARQLPSGNWTSKLGVSEDIEHDTLECLEGELYGQVIQYLKRKP